MAEIGEEDGEDIQGGKKGYGVHGGVSLFLPSKGAYPVPTYYASVIPTRPRGACANL